MCDSSIHLRNPTRIHSIYLSPPLQQPFLNVVKTDQQVKALFATQECLTSVRLSELLLESTCGDLLDWRWLLLCAWLLETCQSIPAVSKCNEAYFTTKREPNATLRWDKKTSRVLMVHWRWGKLLPGEILTTSFTWSDLPVGKTWIGVRWREKLTVHLSILNTDVFYFGRNHVSCGLASL